MTRATVMMRRSIMKLCILLIFPLLYLLHQRQEIRAPFPSIRSVSSAGLFRRDVRQIPFKNNLVAQNEGISRGPWIIDPPLPPIIPTGPFTIRFKCLWHASDLCPQRYIVILRGPTIYAPPLSSIIQDKDDPTVVTVIVNVADPGQYELFAWPEFDPCPKHWREKMRYPINRGQVMGTPTLIDVTGKPLIADSFGPCPLDGSEASGRSEGRWVSKSVLRPPFQRMEWARSYPENQEYIYQPYSCKRPHRTASTVLDNSSTISEILFVGDSVLRGALCSQIWPELSPAGKPDGDCTFIDDAVLYHTSPKKLDYVTPSGKKIGLAFRFMDDRPLYQIDTWKGVRKPSHVVTNLGLWMAPFTVEEYTKIIKSYLERMYELYPEAVYIWRTTTDIAPMIQCFTDKGMTRSSIYLQREASFGVIDDLKARGMRIHVVDAYAMTAPRPDSGNDGRHWVVESPSEAEWLPKTRPTTNEAERAVLDGLWDVLKKDDIERARLTSDYGLS